jgi:hypothetical protein
VLLAAGDFDEAVKTLKVANRVAERDTQGGMGFAGIFGSMVAELMIRAGRLDEAMKMATGKDGKFDPGYVTMFTAYTERDDIKKAKELIWPDISPAARSRFYSNVAMAVIDKLEKKKTSQKNRQPK